MHCFLIDLKQKKSIFTLNVILELLIKKAREMTASLQKLQHQQLLQKRKIRGEVKHDK